MNTVVARTLLRGMFEDRMQNVIRERNEPAEPDAVREVKKEEV